MGCFSMQKGKRKAVVGGAPNELYAIVEMERDGVSNSTPISATRKVLSAPPSFNSPPGKDDNNNNNNNPSSSSSSSSSSTTTTTTLFNRYIGHGISVEVGVGTLTPRPVPLPLPSPPPALNCYPLPLPQHLQTNPPTPPSSSLTSVAISRLANTSHKPPTRAPPSFAPLRPGLLQPLPQPPPEHSGGASPPRSFSYEELASACHNFSPDRCLGESANSSLFYATLKSNSRKSHERTTMEVNLLQLRYKWRQGSCKEWVGEVSKVAQQSSSLQYLCKLIGFCAEEGNLYRILVYERSPGSGCVRNGGLSWLHRSSKGESEGNNIIPMADWLSWHTRMKMAASAAQGLAYLHETMPYVVPYTEFQTFHIEVDSEYGARISGYSIEGLEGTYRNDLQINVNGPPEMAEHGLITQKCNVWSFGVVLLEIITGRTHMDPTWPLRERNLVKWACDFLLNDSHTINPVKKAMELAMHCLHPDPLCRPTMRQACDTLHALLGPVHSHHLNMGTSALGVAMPVAILSPNLRSATSLMANPVQQQQQRQQSQKPIEEEDYEWILERNHPTKEDLIRSPQLRPLVIPKTSSCASIYALKGDGQLLSKQFNHSPLSLESLESC